MKFARGLLGLGLLGMVLCLMLMVGVSRGEEVTEEGASAPAAAAVLEIEDVKKLRVKEIRKLLAARGQACTGCVEKDEFVAKFMEVQSMPVLEPTKPAPPVDKMDPAQRAKLEALMNQLKGSGMGNFKTFTPQDFEGLSPDEMAAKFGGPGGGAGGGKQRRGGAKSGKSKSSGSSAGGRRATEEPGDTVEL